MYEENQVSECHKHECARRYKFNNCDYKHAGVLSSTRSNINFTKYSNCTFFTSKHDVQ